MKLSKNVKWGIIIGIVAAILITAIVAIIPDAPQEHKPEPITQNKKEETQNQTTNTTNENGFEYLNNIIFNGKKIFGIEYLFIVSILPLLFVIWNTFFRVKR